MTASGARCYNTCPSPASAVDRKAVDMEYPIRPITAEEVPAFFLREQMAFGGTPHTAETIDALRPFLELDRTLAAFDGDQIVATAGAYSFELTLPDSVVAPAAGVSWVGVLPTHRRRGLLRSLMRCQ